MSSTQTNAPGAGLSVRAAVLDYPVGPVSRASIKTALFSTVGFKEKRRTSFEYVRALNGVSFDVKAGERIGIIGRNGSGKSTLLRALAGIYPITSGLIQVRGRVQGLFDIGLGFESEATGRENIKYRGLVMGLSPKEIAAREQEIIDFAAIGDFIDLPVRTYSTGMGVRLAFAISTYLQGDILLLDEMLGAGDASFQAKAQARMKDLLSSANIVVLVSHSMEAVQEVCPRALWLDRGKVRADGPSAEVVAAYLRSSEGGGDEQPRGGEHG